MNLLTDTTVRLGFISLATPLLYLLIGVAGGSVVLFLTTKRNKAVREFTFDLLSGFFLFLILTWKLLPVLLSPLEVISNPLLILYSTGGRSGIVLGLIIGIIYLVYRLYNFKKYFIKKEKGKLFQDIILKDLLKPVIVFFIILGIITSSLFIASRAVQKINFDNNAVISPSGRAITGEKAPWFELSDVNGNISNLNDYRGKWIILNFWATWCPPCRAEIPGLIKFYSNMNKGEIVLLGINASGTERAEGDINGFIGDFIRDNGINFPVLLDLTGKVSADYGASSIPTTVVISPEGIITKIKTGVVDSLWLKSAVNQK